MKKLLGSILVLSCFVAHGQTKRVLFLGNSATFVNDLPQMTADIANSMGDTLIYDYNTPGGYTFQEHATNTTSLNKIMQGNRDFVVLQGSGRVAMEIDQVEVDVFPYVYYLDSVITAYNPCGETMFYMTWGLKNGDAANCPIWEPVCTYTGMDNLLRHRYMMMADSNKAVVSPVGAVWRYIRQHYPSIELYVADDTHPSQAGSYAAACCFYTGIFRKDPLTITQDFTLSPSVAEKIRTAVKLVMYDSLLSWHIGEYDLVSDFSHTQISDYTVQFNSQSQNENGQIWDFGSATDTTANPLFTFSDSGTYPIKLTVFNRCDTIVSHQEIYVSGILTSLEDLDMSGKPIIYPNPAGDKLFLNLNSTNGVSIHIYSPDGGNVNTIELLSGNEIDISWLKNGFYLLVIEKGTNMITKKLVVQK